MQLASRFMRNLQLIRAFASTQWRVDTAYIASNIVNILTPIFYVTSFLVFMSVLFDNIHSLGGYGRNEVFFLIFIGQIVFYLTDFWGYESNSELHRIVNNGNLDFLLLRPMNSLFAVTICKIRIMRLLVYSLGPLAPVVILIDWSALHFQIANILAGVVVILTGVVLLHALQFILTLPVFWTGWAQESNIAIFAATSQTIPLEGMPHWFKVVFTGIFPTFLGASVATSIMLGKASWSFWLPVCAGCLVGILGLKRVLWHMALRRYASASS